MRTPKINALYRLIDWVNGHSGPQDTTIPKLPLNTDPIESNAWLAGFIEGEGCFQVRASATSSSKKKDSLSLRCPQRSSPSLPLSHLTHVLILGGSNVETLLLQRSSPLLII